eukprot:CAMPEP_0181375676 /NCGR_PEP_ID=MMETSP1106-20121128/16858_1 /TAXON_ID=81844 /ORGANISM="Mantoniella antarctica, Strain SL-175" /LENGTH=82 /DNA_ID=CAMNT_0023494095 /DNA_START=451 /DNA_END=696 /DNA_ORIENTATION=+
MIGRSGAPSRGHASMRSFVALAHSGSVMVPGRAPPKGMSSEMNFVQQPARVMATTMATAMGLPVGLTRAAIGFGAIFRVDVT